MFAGTEDKIVPIGGNRELREFFRTETFDPIIEYQEIKADHMTFVLGKDMSYFERVIDLINRHNQMDVNMRQQVFETLRTFRENGRREDDMQKTISSTETDLAAL